MFEIGIFCVILLAVGYGVAMWLIRRRADVLHGKFVEAGPDLESLSIGPLLPPPAPRTSAESLQALLTVIQQDLRDGDPAGSEGYGADLPRRPNPPPSLRAARRG